ncbi:hypothetical protein C1752_03733 [Acaryochloris thomasi RCC1774]|uniref:Uncharacterized protein n=1 Tax=Acaryochloris thomasi RCC1774 TaxID=1764569 RepID=A0A2W1JQQ3_9CYAN|nr:hypothetical protein [Acaryochloris thomasi]PZD72444.1 hypothetical protein C1752_03733 [Acaryochloris thomasi RCC1774]
MSLVVGQIVYSSFPRIGYQIFANAEMPESVQSAFVEDIVHKHWDVYEPPPPGYRAGFIHQAHPDHTLFGWLFNDGDDDHGRPHTPYCLSYHLNQPLESDIANFIVQCLQKGPVALIPRHIIPEQPGQLEITSDYEPAGLGVTFTAVQQQQIQEQLQHPSLLQCFLADSGVPTLINEPITKAVEDEFIEPQVWHQPLIHPDLAAPAPAQSVATASGQRTLPTLTTSQQKGDLATLSAGPPSGNPPGQRAVTRKPPSEDLARQIISILDETL